MAHKIEISEDLTQPYVAPEGATLEQLRELAQSANEAALALLNKDNVSDDDLAKANWLATAIDAVNESASGLEAAEAEKAATLEALKGRFTPADPQEDADVAGQVEAPVAAPVADAAVLVAAAHAAKAPSIAEIAAAQKRPDVANIRRTNGVVSLVAAADVPGFGNGQALNIDELGKVFEARAKGFAGMAGTKGSTRPTGFANIVLAADESLVASASDDNIQEVLLHAVDERRLPGGSLVAASSQGWCAPSETLYDLLNVSTSDGLISLPEITVTRGGVKYALGPDFSTVYAGGGFTTLTEAQVISGTTKNVFNIPCPSWTDHRMGADVAYFTGDILSERGFPEGKTDYITKALIAFDHLTSANTIADMVAGSTAVALTSSAAPQADLGAVPTLLGALELQIEDMKYRNRLGRGQSVELVLPFFARGILRSDLAKRQGTDMSTVNVTDAQIDELFRDRGANPQYVYDWQENISTGGTANPFGGATAASTWPQTLKALLYPAGTWARALNPVIELSTVYDSTLLTNNQYVALFTERGRLTLKRGFDSRVVTLLSNPSGLTSGYVAQTHPAAATLY